MSHFERLGLYDSELRKRVAISPSGVLRADKTVALISASFIGTTLDVNYWTSTVANAGTNTLGSGQAVLRTNTTADGSAALESKHTARFIGPTINYFHGVVRLSTAGTTNNVRRWGVFNADNGFFFQLSASTFSVISRRATVDTTVSSGSFNGTSTTFTMDTNAHVYEIFYNDMYVWFFIDNVLYHTVTGSTATLAASLNLKITMSNTNSGGSISDVQMEARSVSVARIGEVEHKSQYVRIAAGLATTIVKYGPGTIKRININTHGAGANTLTVYDNIAASGTVIALIDTVAAGEEKEYNAEFFTGLTVVSATGTGADLTIEYE